MFQEAIFTILGQETNTILFPKMKPTGTHKKKEERFYPRGQLL